jgi:RIO kinase 1
VLPETFYDAQLITGVVRVVQSGKEATVYCCRAHPSTGAEYLAPAEARPLFPRVVRNIETCLACGVVHGDLSPFNILYWQRAIRIIDFPQAVDPYRNRSAFSLLARDVENICHYFESYGLRADAPRLAQQLWSRTMQGEL